MTESATLPPQGGRLMLSSRQYRSTSQSPSRQSLVTDDLLSHLSPMNAVETLRAPVGSLKSCMEGATTNEQSFAMRAALASKNIYEWLDELREWPWSTEGGGLGFQAPAPKGREATLRGRAGSVIKNDQEEQSASDEDEYMGSLSVADVVRYEQRVDGIQQEMEELNFEEIKRHVLHNHIFPLSRPGTPVSPTFEHYSMMSSISSIVKMDDLTAVITATVIQALPNLSRLVRLMNIWTVRLTVLRRVPTMLSSLSDAESAIQSGWSAVQQGTKNQIQQSSNSELAQGSKLSQNDFEAMKMVLEKKVSEAGHHLDYMLDTLEGREDTLPDEWCDRMDALERDYSEWVTACQVMIREAEIGVPRAKAAQSADAVSEAEQASIATTNNTKSINNEHGHINGSASIPSKVVINVHPAEDQAQETEALDRVQGHELLHPSVEDAGSFKESPTISITNDQGATQGAEDSIGDSRASDVEFDVIDELPQGDSTVEREPSLPPFPQEAYRPGTAISNASTVIHSASKDTGTPGLTRQNGDFSSPCTPPRKRERSSSVCLSDMPTVLEYPDDESIDKTSCSSSFIDEGNSSDGLGSPIVLAKGQGKATTADEHLQHQISEILDNIPAKIHLSTQPARINHLNPPDLHLPFLKPKSVAERPGRSHSSMSSRAVTPSFMLAPAPRPRHQRGNQDIKMYHLSRTTGETPIKLFIRCVGENGERVMVRVGGGWADLGEYLKEYAVHHGRRSHVGGDSRVEIKDLPRSASSTGYRSQQDYSPPSRPGSVMDRSPSPLHVRKTRKKSAGTEDLLGPKLPKTPMAIPASAQTPEPSSSGSGSTGRRSRSSSHVSWSEDESSLGMAGPKSKNKEIPEESLAWIESIKEKVRAASDSHVDRKFGEMGKVGGTKRLFRKPSAQK